MYSIKFSKTAERQLYKLEKNTQSRIISALERIRTRPEAFVTKLIGETAYKFRAGDYRIIMDIKHDELLILVIKIGHRKNYYG